MKRSHYRIRNWLSAGLLSFVPLAMHADIQHQSTFEPDQGFSIGSLDGQSDWKVETGEAQVVNQEGRDGSAGLKVLPSSPAGSVSVSVPLPVYDGSQILFSEIWVRPGADGPHSAGFAEAQGALTGFFRVAAGGELFVFNGDGHGRGQWLPTGVQLGVTENGQAEGWVRLSIRQDYNEQVWDLFINGTIFRANMGLWKERGNTSEARYVFSGTTAQPLYLDDFAVATENLLFSDADRDGLPDDWELGRGLDATNGARDHDPDNDGLSNVEELVLGAEPLVADTDGDGMSDGQEYLLNRDPGSKERHWQNLKLDIPQNPTADFIKHRVVLSVPFVVTAPATSEDCNAVLTALDGYTGLREPEKIEVLEEFLQTHSNSPFALWVKGHAAHEALRGSRFSKALKLLEELWAAPARDSKSERLVRTFIGANLASTYHLYGRTDQMGSVIQDMESSELPSGISERLYHLKSDYRGQKFSPEQINRCGVSSLVTFLERIDSRPLNN